MAREEINKKLFGTYNSYLIKDEREPLKKDDKQDRIKRKKILDDLAEKRDIESQTKQAWD